MSKPTDHGWSGKRKRSNAQRFYLPVAIPAMARRCHHALAQAVLRLRLCEEGNSLTWRQDLVEEGNRTGAFQMRISQSVVVVHAYGPVMIPILD